MMASLALALYFFMTHFCFSSWLQLVAKRASLKPPDENFSASTSSSRGSPSCHSPVLTSNFSSKRVAFFFGFGLTNFPACKISDIETDFGNCVFAVAEGALDDLWLSEDLAK